MDWRGEYQRVLEDLPRQVEGARPVVALTSACVDSRFRLADVKDLAPHDPDASALLTELAQRARSGTGGEIVRSWLGGPAWLESNFRMDHAWGGTGPHAAMALTAVGAPSLTALGDRSPSMLSVIPHEVPLAGDNGPQAAGSITPQGQGKPNVFIVEYTAGENTVGVVPPRSSRIILRFGDLGFETDKRFDRLSSDPAFGAGAALVAGFQCVPAHDLAHEYTRIRNLIAAWKKAGVEVIHLELAGFETNEQCHEAMTQMAGHVTSIGMSHSEFQRYFGGNKLGPSMIEQAHRLRVTRFCIHADEWAATATLHDPDRERLALMTGSLMAATRAATGHAVRPIALPDAYIGLPMFSEATRRDADGWSLVSVPTLYQPTPKTTLGMGDTFTGGCLMVLSNSASGTRLPVS